MGSQVSMENSSSVEDDDSSTTPVHALFVPALPSLTHVVEKVAKVVCQRERNSLHDRALALALVARFRFQVPKDISCLLFRLVLRLESRDGLAIRELEHVGKNGESLRVLYFSPSSERTKEMASCFGLRLMDCFLCRWRSLSFQAGFELWMLFHRHDSIFVRSLQLVRQKNYEACAMFDCLLQSGAIGGKPQVG